MEKEIQEKGRVARETRAVWLQQRWMDRAHLHFRHLAEAQNIKNLPQTGIFMFSIMHVELCNQGICRS